MKTPEAAPWLKWIQEKTLSKWPSTIRLLEASEVTPETDQGRSVLVTDKLPGGGLLDLVMATGIQHVIQVSNPKFDHAVNFAAALIEGPEKFLAAPEQAFFTSRERAPDAVSSKAFTFRSTKEKGALLKDLATYLESIPKTITVRDGIHAIADELFTNVIFNAPIDDEGFRKFVNLPRNTPVELDPGKEGRIVVAHDAQSLLIYCEDNYGSANPEKVLGRIHECYKLGASAAMRVDGPSSGIGCYMMYQHANTFVVAIQPRHKTVIACTILLGLPYKLVSVIPKNLHIVVTA